MFGSCIRVMLWTDEPRRSLFHNRCALSFSNLAIASRLPFAAIYLITDGRPRVLCLRIAFRIRLAHPLPLSLTLTLYLLSHLFIWRSIHFLNCQYNERSTGRVAIFPLYVWIPTIRVTSHRFRRVIARISYKSFDEMFLKPSVGDRISRFFVQYVIYVFIVKI